MTAASLSDEEITKLAKARVGFRIHALVYVLVNLFLVAIWWITQGSQSDGRLLDGSSDRYFWPVWPILGWGIGLAINGFVVYGGGTEWQRREEEKLRAKFGRRP